MTDGAIAPPFTHTLVVLCYYSMVTTLILSLLTYHNSLLTLSVVCNVFIC